MSWQLSNEAQFPKCMFVLSLADSVIARHLQSLIKNRTETTMETKLPDSFADYMKKLYSCLTSYGGIERIYQLSISCGPGYMRNHLDNIELNLKQVFFAKMTFG